MTIQNQEGDDQNNSGKVDDPTNQKGTESLKGKVDKQGIPLDAEERADHYKKLSEKTGSDFKEYQTNSSRGVQNLSDKNKILEDENQRLKGGSQSHEEENVSREEFSKLEKRQDETEKQQRVEANKREFGTQCKNLIEQEEFKNIKSRRAEFEEYAYEDENLNTPIEVLARSFQVVKGLIKSKPPEEGDGDEGRPGIEEGTGGGDHKPSEKGYTSEQAENMRTDDPKKYNRLVKEGKLKIVD
jgi:hypothetical protein